MKVLVNSKKLMDDETQDPEPTDANPIDEELANVDEEEVLQNIPTNDTASLTAK